MRYLIVLLIGLAIGAALTVVGMNYLHQANAYPDGVMTVMSVQMKAIDRTIKQNRCATSDLMPKLQTLRFIGNDIEPAFGDMNNNEQFQRYASDMRATLDAALIAPPSNCPDAEAVFSKIGKTCSACHRDYKS